MAVIIIQPTELKDRKSLSWSTYVIYQIIDYLVLLTVSYTFTFLLSKNFVEGKSLTPLYPFLRTGS